MDYDKNWRERIGKKRNKEELNWRIHLHAEYVKFLLEVEQLSEKYNWDFSIWKRWKTYIGSFAFWM